MMNSPLSLLILVLWSCFFSGHALNYNDLESWGDTCNAGSHQSPIDLRATLIKRDKSQPIKFSNYDSVSQQIIVENHDNIIHVTGKWVGERPSVTGSLLNDDTYVFKQGHMHWSKRNDDGTEHSINGRKYATELHLVHYNRKYGNSSEASKHKDGMAVISVLYKVDNFEIPNRGMSELAYFVATAVASNRNETIKSLDLASFLPNPIRALYSYEGSLTTPPCTENVSWIVMANPEPINSLIMNMLRVLAFEHNNHHNARPVQNTNDRSIDYYILPHANVNRYNTYV